MNIGRYYISGYEGPYYFNGQISDVKIYNRALSASEILDLYQGKEVSGAILDMPLSDKTGFKDISGNGYHGTNNGASIIGEAASFDGTDDYIDLGNPTSLNFPSNGKFTIAYWLKWDGPMGAGDSHQCVISKGTHCGTNYTHLVAESNNRLNIYINGDCGVELGSVDNYVNNDGNWHYYVQTYNGTSITLYKDGGNKKTSSSGISSTTTSSNITIGQVSGGSYPFNGQIADIQIYNRDLSEAEIKSLYAKGRSNAGSVGITTGSLNKGLILDMPLKSKNGRAEATTNLSYLYDSDLNWNNPWNNSGTATWNSNDTSINPPDIAGKENYKIVSMRKDTSGNSHVGVGNANITTNTVYTVSTWVYLDTVASPSGIQPYIRPQPDNQNRGDLYYNGITSWNQWPKRQWIRISRTFTSPAENASSLYISSYLNTAGDKIYYFAPQIEQKDHLTPFTGPARLDQTADTTPYGNHGTIYGATVGTNYTTFTAANDNKVAVTVSQALPNSVSIWFSGNSLSGAYYLYGKSDTYNGVYIYTESGSSFVAVRVNNVNYQYTWTYSTGWHNLITVRDGTNIIAYMDGILLGSQTDTTTAYNTALEAVGSRGTSNYDFNGNLANFKIYNRALSASEIKSLFDKERSQFGV